MERKIIQVVEKVNDRGINDMYTVLCDDGTLWKINCCNSDKKWVKVDLPPIDIYNIR